MTASLTVFTVWHWDLDPWVRVAFSNVLTIIGSLYRLFKNFFFSSVYWVYWANFISRLIQIFWSLSCRYFQALNTSCTTIRTASTKMFWKLVIGNEHCLNFVKGFLFTSGESCVCNCLRSREPFKQRRWGFFYLLKNSQIFTIAKWQKARASPKHKKKHRETIFQN